MRVSAEVVKVVHGEACDSAAAVPGLAWFSETSARMMLESPELATTLAMMGYQSLIGGALVYDAMQRQIRKDALAAMEASK